MNVQIKYHHMNEMEDLTEHIEEKLAFALDRFERGIRRVEMHVYDLNGPRGGVDKKCLALVELKPGGRVAFEHTDKNAFSAVARVAGRLKERLRREFDRHRSKRHVDGIHSLETIEGKSR